MLSTHGIHTHGNVNDVGGFHINQQYLVASKKVAQVSIDRSLAKQDAHCHHLVAGV